MIQVWAIISHWFLYDFALFKFELNKSSSPKIRQGYVVDPPEFGSQSAFRLRSSVGEFDWKWSASHSTLSVHAAFAVDFNN
jgi:hypothetical protein